MSRRISAFGATGDGMQSGIDDLPFLELLEGVVASTAFQALAGENMPEPYRSLLVHQSDMTHTLERFHADLIRLRILKVSEDIENYRRQVILETARRGQVVEFGAIRIFLERFPTPSRDLILAGETPLGAILRRCAIKYRSAPRRFFSMSLSPEMSELMRVETGAVAFGRCNVLRNPEGADLAQIIEILPPVTHERQTVDPKPSPGGTS